MDTKYHSLPVQNGSRMSSCLTKIICGKMSFFILGHIYNYYSLQSESGGTVLSTNWGEVGNKKIDVKTPDGMEFKKYET